MGKPDLNAEFNGYTGTEGYHFHPLGIQLTDGAKAVADKLKCYWLMDLIASYQPRCMKDRMLCAIQFWCVTVEEDHSASVACNRDEDDTAFVQEVEHTTLPMGALRLWVQDGVVLLPSEY